jgi:hypothetical protein
MLCRCCTNVIIMPRLCHPATKRGGRKRVTSQYSQFKDCRLTGTMANISLRFVSRYLFTKDVAPVEMHPQLVKVCISRAVLREQMWIWCNALENGRTEFWQQAGPARPSASTTNDRGCRADGSIMEDMGIKRPLRMTEGVVQMPVSWKTWASNWVTLPESETFRRSVRTALFSTKWITKRVCTGGAKTPYRLSQRS